MALSIDFVSSSLNRAPFKGFSCAKSALLVENLCQTRDLKMRIATWRTRGYQADASFGMRGQSRNSPNEHPLDSICRANTKGHIWQTSENFVTHLCVLLSCSLSSLLSETFTSTEFTRKLVLERGLMMPSCTSKYVV